MTLEALFGTLAIAFGLGLLVGLQRERSASMLAGFRTFPLVTVLGLLCGILAKEYGGWIVAAGFVGLAVLIFAGNQIRMRVPDPDPGLTTEAALLVMFAVGAYLTVGQRSVAVVIGAAVAVLLYLKPQLHGFARQLGEPDFKAIMQFVLISLVILPVLPNRAYGPYQVLNPQRIWLLVVFIVGISLSGYVVYKFLGGRVGVLVAGILGGLISSTATTVSYARQDRAGPDLTRLASVVIMLASTVVYGRVLAIIGATAPGVFWAVAPPILILLTITIMISVVLWLKSARQAVAMPVHSNPSELKSAIVFALLFAVVLLATAAGKSHFGNQGLYLVAVISGLTDMDAITLSTAQMTKAGTVGPDTAWRLILVASMSNLVFKGITVAMLGTPKLARRVGALFGIVFSVGLAVLLLWRG